MNKQDLILKIASYIFLMAMLTSSRDSTNILSYLLGLMIGILVIVSVSFLTRDNSINQEEEEKFRIMAEAMERDCKFCYAHTIKQDFYYDEGIIKIECFCCQEKYTIKMKEEFSFVKSRLHRTS